MSDVSDASRLDTELSRVTAQPVDVVPILRTLQELDEATREEDDDPKLEVVAPPNGLAVWAVEDRLVQVLRDLIGNARSFSPPGGRIVVRVREAGGMAELCVEDDGPGIPDAEFDISSTDSTPSGRRVRVSASIRAWACRSAGRSSRHCVGRFRPKTDATARAACGAPGSSCACRWFSTFLSVEM